jgi:hypothetical protein
VRDTCAARSRAGDEPLHGTASRARRWILLEQPGAWGPDALATSALPPHVAVHLARAARTVPARVLLLRRPRGRRQPDGTRSLYIGWTAPGGGWFEHLELAAVDDLLELDLRPLGAGRSVGGERLTEPLYLVCTNGGHDPCCAEYGLPVARALEALVGDRVWESSHVGGDRFAGNLVCLPEGAFYGRLDPATATAAVAAHERGRVLLEHWRGTSAVPFAAQAAEALLRRVEGRDELLALRFAGMVADGDLRRVRFVRSDGAGEVTATVRVGRRTVPPGLTCAGTGHHTPTYELVEVASTTA